MARLSKRVWENKLTTNTKMSVYNACVLSTLLYGSETWTRYTRQERCLNSFHLCCLRRILGITWQERVPNTEGLRQGNTLSMFALLSQRRLRWLGHVHRMEYGRLPKDFSMTSCLQALDQSAAPCYDLGASANGTWSLLRSPQSHGKLLQTNAATGRAPSSQASREQRRRENNSGRTKMSAEGQEQLPPRQCRVPSCAGTATETVTPK